MLNKSEKNSLRDGLQTPPHPDSKVALTGETYQELADELKQKLKITATPRSVRHYVQAIARRYQGWKRRPLRKGRPKKLELKPSEHLIKEVSEYLLQLTGFSESTLYKLLLMPMQKKYLPMGKVTYHNLFKDSRKQRKRDPSNRFIVNEAKTLIDYCCIVMGQALLTPLDKKEHWLLLWGIDTATHFVNFQLINLIPEIGPIKNLKGRPRTPLDPITAVWQTTDSGQVNIQLPTTILASFLNDCQRRLCLPVSRVVLPYGYPQGYLTQTVSNKTLTQVQVSHIALRLSEAALLHLPSIPTLKDCLEQTTNRQNKYNAKKQFNPFRREIRKLVENYRNRMQESWFPKMVREDWPEAAALDDFYNDEPRFSAKSMYLKRKLIRLGVVFSS